MAETMRAAVFEGTNESVLEEKPFPHCGPTDAIVKVSLGHEPASARSAPIGGLAGKPRAPRPAGRTPC